MAKSARLEQLEKKKAKLEELKAKIRAEESKVAKAQRKERDTALFTIGGTFAALLEDEATKEQALALWGRFLAHQAPKMMTDRRKAALKAQFGLEPKDAEKGSIPLPPSADSTGASPGPRDIYSAGERGDGYQSD